MNDCDATRAEDAPSVDAVFDALTDPRRRSVCRYVMRTDVDVITQEELVDYVVERAPESDPEDLESHRVATELHHVHLPKLDAAGILEYDPQSRIVYADRAATTERLECVRKTIAELQDERSSD